MPKCRRCNSRKTVRGLTSCEPCRVKGLRDARLRRLRRLRRGVCPDCGARPVEPGRAACCVCLEANALRKRIDRPWERYEDPTAGERVAKWRAKQRAHARCTLCGRAVTEINPRTLRPFGMCMPHRMLATLRRRQWRARQRRRA